jgi:sarcosine oxidase, subunit gamma
MAYDVEIRPIAPYGLLNLRARPDARVQIGHMLGVDLPLRPNTTASHEDRVIFWLGPDEWLLRVPDGDEQRWQADLRGNVQAGNTAVTVVTDAHLVIGLSGPDSREILSQGVELDTHERAFAPGQCARIRFAKALVLLHYVDAKPTHHLYVARSYAQYLERWLQFACGV